MSVFTDMQSQLTKKLGPLPVWGWGVIGAAGVWIVRSFAGASRPGPARTSTSGGLVSVGSGSGAALPGSYPPPISPAYGMPTTPLSVTTDRFAVSGEGGDVLKLMKDFVYVGTQREDTTVAQPPREVMVPLKLGPTDNKKAFKPVIPTPQRKVSKAPTMYTIKRGDTLSRIARAYGTTWRTLWALNSSRLRSGNPDLIFPGETIQVS